MLCVKTDDFDVALSSRPSEDQSRLHITTNAHAEAVFRSAAKLFPSVLPISKHGNDVFFLLCNMLENGEAYRDPADDDFTRHDPEGETAA